MTTTQTKTKLQMLDQNWQDCTRCKLGATAHKHCLYDAGHLPENGTDVMFIGEGPGASENLQGLPFIGPSGRLLRNAVMIAGNRRDLKVVYTNLVACRPTDDNRKDRPPTDTEVVRCLPRLVGLLEIFKPRVIVACGRVAETHLMNMHHHIGAEDIPVPNILAAKAIRHPAWVLRQGGVNGPEWGPYVASIREAIR